MNFALVGNQNCGKTTLFNQLTGSNQHVGNFPGVTVSSKTGEIRNLKNCTAVDLPGIYSLRPFSGEEIVTRDFIINEKPEGIINIVDAMNIERNLYLTLQLLEMRVPTVIALNMMDEVRANGGTVDIHKLSEELGVPVVPISAAKNEGIDELVNVAYETAKAKILPKRVDFCEQGAVHRCIHAVTHLIEDHAEAAGIAARFAAVKTVEGDKDIVARLEINENEREMIEHSVVEMETECGTDRNAALAAMRYEFIEKVVADAVKKPDETKEHKRSEKIDKILTNKYLAIPIFIAGMLLIFFLTFEVIGKLLSDLLAMGIDALSSLTAQGLDAWGVNPVIKSLIIDGVFAGVGSVLSFLPLIVVLFFFLSILEDTGYMARVAFVMDKLLRKIGLSGRSFVPMLIGFGCTVPAVMATRTLSSERDRKMTVLLTPYMSCSAKIPIYTVFTAAFFPKYRALVMLGLYVFGMIVGILVALAFKRTKFKGNPVPFVMELPNYRFPSAKSVGLLMWDKAKDFLVRAFTVIFLATLVIWFLQTFDYRLNVAATSGERSILELIGRLIAPIFAPLGFGDWRASTALIAGFTAKESVVSTLGVLLGVGSGDLTAALSGVFTPLTAVSFLTFVLLYTPCVAAIAAIKREFNSGWAALSVALMQCVVAYAAAFAVYTVGSLVTAARLFGAADIVLIVLIAAIVVLDVVYVVRKKRQGKCVGCSGDCSSCGKKDKAEK
ncbi:MAG: ferrous iron transport protein B [Bacillota bacterium]|nr:MAG: ferrous iron transport protein B [Bacillota bacterium]